MMTDIQKDLRDTAIDLWMHKPKCSDEELYKLLMQAADEIQRLRQANSDMSWRLNPDRMGGQFTDEELNRGNEWL
jgi:hypothetical protein